MEGQQSSEKEQPAHRAECQSWDTSNPGHQQMQQWNSSSSRALDDTHDSTATAGCGSIDGVKRHAKEEKSGEEETSECSLLAKVDPGIHLAVGQLTEEGCGSRRDSDQLGAKPVTTGTDDENGNQDMNTGVDLDVFRPNDSELRPEEAEDILEGDFEDNEFGDKTFAVTGMGVASLDELAKRIKVEQTAPTPVLVSILKRRSSMEGYPPQPLALPKQAHKRKVRFNEPDNMADPDEVGLDSCLLLLLLCMVTMMISVGGTALYCTLGNAQSSVCTDFSHNVEFYLSQVQRGVEEISHWLSHSS